MNRFILTAVLVALVALVSAAQASAVYVISNPPVYNPPPPVAISGTAQPGNQLSCSTGNWTDPLMVDGFSVQTIDSYKYQWTLDGVDIAGATSSTYTVADGDVGKPLRCEVWAHNADGYSLSPGTSDPVTPTAPSSGGDSGGGGQVALPSETAVIQAPSTKKCASKRNFKIHIRSADGVTYTGATVFVNNKQVKAVKQAKLTAPVDLRGLFKGRFTVKIVVDTSDGRQITGKRKYKTCTRGTGKSKKKPKL